MSLIKVSIWGIKDGFEPNGIFHTHDLPDVKRLWIENDSYRDFSSQDCYIIQYTEAHVVVSLYHSKVKEYAAPGKQRRPGYVIISLIIPGGKCFSSSPLGVLKRLLAKYKEEIVDSNTRNITWNTQDIDPFVNALTLQLGPIGRRPEKKFLEFISEDQIADLLKCDKAFANFEELILVPQGTTVRGRTPLNLQLEEVNYIKQQEEEARRKEAERQLNEKVRLEEDLIRTLCAENNWDEALKRFQAFSERAMLSGDLQQKMSGYQSKLFQQNEDQKKKEADERKLKPLNEALRNGDAARAVDIYDSLFFQDIVPLELTTLIYQYKKELSQQREDEERQRKEKERKKKLFIFLGAGAFGLLTLLFSISFLMSWPTFLYDNDGDGIVNVQDKCPEVPGLSKFEGCKDSDGDGVGDNKDECPKEKGVKNCQGCKDQDKDGIRDLDDPCPKDSLNQCKDSIPKSLEENKRIKIPDNVPESVSKLKNQFVWYKDGKWYFSKDEKKGINDQEIKTCESYNYLNKRYQQKFKCPFEKPKETGIDENQAISITTEEGLNNFRNEVAQCFNENEPEECKKCKEWQDLGKKIPVNLKPHYNNLNTSKHPCPRK